MRHFTFALILLTAHYAKSQNYEWSHSFGGTSLDEVLSVATDPIDNSVYLTGHFFESFDGIPGTPNSMTNAVDGFDLFLIKLDESGNFIWMNIIGSIDHEQGMELTVDAQQNVILLAQEQPKTSVYKFDSMGGLIWYYSTDYTSTSSPESIATDSEGNIYVTGTFSDTVDFDNSTTTEYLIAEGNEDAFILKLNLDGQYVWSKSMGSSTGGALGRSIEISAQDEIIMSGFFYGTVNFDPNSAGNILSGFGSSDVFTSKLDTSGNLIWVKQTGGSQSNQVGDIVLDYDGNIYSIGHFEGSLDADPSASSSILFSNAATDIFIQKLNTNGEFVWAQSIGGSGYDVPHGICTDPSGDLYITGNFSGLVDFDTSPQVNTLETDNSADAFILKISEDGEFHWARQFVGIASYNSGYDIAVDNQNNILIGGGYMGTADFNPGPSQSMITSIESFDGFLVKLNQDASGIFENNSSQIEFYPNPTSGIIQANRSISGVFNLYNIDGKIVESIQSPNGQLDFSHLEKGTYLLVPENMDQVFKSSKIIIE